jgi:hypothetical protein
MAKTKRIKGKLGRPNNGAKKRIADMKEKYGDVITLIHDVDRKPGSPTLYKPDYNRMVFWLALAGMTEYEMANVFGISDNGFQMWKKSRPDFLKALQSGKMESIGVAANSLFRVATGYTHDAVKLIPNRVKEYHPDTGKLLKEYTTVIHEPYTKHYPPNVTALLKFLAAKYPEVWGDKSEVVHSGIVSHSIDASKLTKKQLKTLREIAQSGIKPQENNKKSNDKKREIVEKQDDADEIGIF